MNKVNLPERIFKALMHPARLSILEILREGEQCVCHLEAVLGCRQAYISQHLMVLREAGLVEDRRDGSRIFYRVIKPDVFELVDKAILLTGGSLVQEQRNTIAGCACPKCNPTQAGESGKSS